MCAIFVTFLLSGVNLEGNVGTGAAPPAATRHSAASGNACDPMQMHDPWKPWRSTGSRKGQGKGKNAQRGKDAQAQDNPKRGKGAQTQNSRLNHAFKLVRLLQRDVRQLKRQLAKRDACSTPPGEKVAATSPRLAQSRRKRTK